LIFGILISTLLTLVLIPVLYYAYAYKRVDKIFSTQWLLFYSSMSGISNHQKLHGSKVLQSTNGRLIGFEP